MNYYEILGVERNVTPKDLKKAYKKLARKWHPDLNKDNLKVAEEKMREINVAYDTLSDEVKRLDYDKKIDSQSQTQGQKKSGRTTSTQGQKKTSARTSTTSGKVDFENIHSSFESFWGFNPKTHEVSNEDKLNTFAKDRRKKNPLDTTDFFEKFMGLKK